MIPRSVTSVNDFIDFMGLTTSFMLYYINGWRCTVGLPTKNAHWPPCGHPVRVPWCFWPTGPTGPPWRFSVGQPIVCLPTENPQRDPNRQNCCLSCVGLHRQEVKDIRECPIFIFSSQAYLFDRIWVYFCWVFFTPLSASGSTVKWFTFIYTCSHCWCTVEFCCPWKLFILQLHHFSWNMLNVVFFL